MSIPIKISRNIFVALVISKFVGSVKDQNSQDTVKEQDGKTYSTRQ